MSFYPKFYLDKIRINRHGRAYRLGKNGALKNDNFLLFFPKQKKDNIEAYGFF